MQIQNAKELHSTASIVSQGKKGMCVLGPGEVGRMGQEDPWARLSAQAGGLAPSPVPTL